MRQLFCFLVLVAGSSVGLQQLNAMGHDRHVSVKEQTVLGHRIGPSGQVMLVTK